MSRIAVVTEGPTDFLILRAIIQKLVPQAEVIPWHPAVPISAYPEYVQVIGGVALGTGWRGVKQWCQEYGKDLEALMHAVIDDYYDLLVVHVDASIADKVGIEAACPPASATTDPLKDVVRSWLQREDHPAFLIIATPSKYTDAWGVAAVAPGFPEVECDLGVERELVRRKYAFMKSGRVRKDRTRYERLAQRVAAAFDAVRQECSEADRFAVDVEEGTS